MKSAENFLKRLQGREERVSVARYFDEVEWPATTEELVAFVGKKRITIGNRRLMIRSLLRELGDREFGSPGHVDRLINRSRGRLALLGALLKGRRPIWVVAGTAGLAVVAGAVKLIEGVRRRRHDDDEELIAETLRRASGVATAAPDNMTDEDELEPAIQSSPSEISTSPV